jgi:hypothetical protein
MRYRATICILLAFLLFARPVAAEWRAYAGAKRDKKELVKAEKESGIRLVSVNGSPPTWGGEVRELPVKHPVWPVIYFAPGQTTVRLAVECLECQDRIGSFVQGYDLKTEAIELQFEMDLGKKYLFTWSWSKHRGVIPTADVRIWAEVDRPLFGVDPHGEKIVEQTVTVPLIDERQYGP